MATDLSELAGECTNRPLPSAARRAGTTMRHDLRASMIDGMTCSVMMGITETYLPAFALALGMGQVVAGLVASVPILAGAFLQLVSPRAIRLLGSNRRWVVLCVVFQALSFLPLAITALVGKVPVAVLFLLSAMYWGSGLASGPAWNHWMDSLVPQRIRAHYFGRRQRMSQAGLLLGFAGAGISLEFGEMLGRPLVAFALLYLAAAVCRFISAASLATQSEPPIARAAASAPGGLRSLIRRLWNSGDGRMLVYLWMVQFGAYIAVPYFAPYMLGHLHFSYAQYMFIVSSVVVTKVLALPTLGRVAQRYGAWRLLVIGGLGVIPMAALWTVSTNVIFLLLINFVSGFVWGAFELGFLLLFFEAIDVRQRVAMLTLYNVGYASATVAGSVCGALLLATLGAGSAGYAAVFLLSSLARLCAAPLLWRVRLPKPAEPTVVLEPVFVEDSVEEFAAPQAA